MANYVFENLTTAQAAGFTSSDYLIFGNSSTTASSLTVTPADSSGLYGASITLSDGTHSFAFSASALSSASLSSHLIFNDASNLVLGTTGADTSSSFAGTSSNDVIYGFGGADSLGGGAGNDYVYGGADADTVTGGDGNDHLYGNALGVTQGTTDGADSLVGGNGSDYIQGNAGADTIDGGAGSDHIFGGADNDTIIGGDGNDTVNGNLGDDSISGGADNDYLRGGQGADTILGGTGDDIIKGDLGADSIVGGQGHDVVEGGDGADIFSFGSVSVTSGSTTTVTSDASYSTSGTSSYVTDQITDYADGTDRIALGFTVTAVLHDTTGQTFTTAAAAQTYARGLLSSANTTGDVVALNVGSDTYLFYNNAGAATGASASQTDAAIKILGLDSANLTATSGSSDFA